MAIDTLKRKGNHTLAFEKIEGKSPETLFLGGYASSMEGEKARGLAARAREKAQAFLRFDYSGHGRSEGRFEDFTLSQGIKDACDIINAQTTGPVILVGSSMGGWIALRLAQEMPGKIAAILGLSTAPDFTQDVKAQLSPLQKSLLEREGQFPLPAPPGIPPQIMTQKFLADGDRHLIFQKSASGNNNGEEKYTLPCPVLLLHGKRDATVPWQTAEALRQHLAAPSLSLHFIEDGDHSLSRPQDLAQIEEKLETLRKQVTTS